MTTEPLHRENRSINYRVYALASSLSKGAMRFYESNFNISLPEMRLLSTLGSKRRLTSLQFVKLTAMDKGLVSRVLATMTKRGYVECVPSATNANSRIWKLTRAGAALYARLQPQWQAREARLQADLTQTEHDLLLRLLERLFHASEKLRAEETKTLKSTKTKRAKAKIARTGSE